MSEIRKRKEALEERIRDLEETLSGLKSQLRAESEREQHEAIDRLEEYLGAVDNKHANLQEFWKVLREEIRELFSGSSKKPGQDT